MDDLIRVIDETSGPKAREARSRCCTVRDEDNMRSGFKYVQIESLACLPFDTLATTWDL